MRKADRHLLVAALLIFLPVLASATPGDPGASRNTLERLRGLLDPDPAPAARHHLATVTPSSAELIFRLRDHSELSVELSEGVVRIGHEPVGHYSPGGELEDAWWDLVSSTASLPTEDAVLMVREWAPRGLQGEDAKAARRIRERTRQVKAALPSPAPQAIPPAPEGGLVIDLSDLGDQARLEPLLARAVRESGPGLRITVPGGQARLGDFSVGSGESLVGHLLVLEGTADVYGRLDGNLLAVDGDIVIHPGAFVSGDVLAVGGHVHDEGGEVTGEIRTLGSFGPDAGAPVAEAAPALSPVTHTLRSIAGLAGVFLTLLGIGFGLVLFGRPQLEILSDTVSHSFGRAFVVGVLAQVLALPTFGMLVVGLILTVVGVLLVPFAVIAFVLLAIVAILAGFLSVAHAMGETYTRRRLAAGILGSPNSYQYVVTGLVGIAAVWSGWAVFGWVPVAGYVMLGAAGLVTWLLATAGLGAALLSRLGARENFAGRILPAEALTDEYLWATPQFGVPAGRRPGAPRTPER